MLRTALRVVLVLLLVLLVGGVGAAVWVRMTLHGSLPQTRGIEEIPGLSAPVTVVRDALGVPTISAISRPDAARALGFVHAQDRFFQMDLQRRQPAGELAALVGVRALAADRAARVHRFRTVAERALAKTSAQYRAVLDAYAAGVNAGLAALDAPPFEYLLLRTAPEPWRAEDSLLTVLAMFNTLQGRQAAFERTFGTLRDTLPRPMYDFLTARGSAWDAPVVGDALPRPPIPGPDVYTLPRARVARASRLGDVAAWPEPLPADEAAIVGSNNWAVAGTRTASGAAILANDMHLAINVPNIWYRAVLEIGRRRIAGVTLPGLPSIVVGSNGDVAWGFTNTGGDWSDLVIIEPDPRDPGQYLTPDGPRAFETFSETIAVSGGAPETITVRATVWGPIIGTDHRGRELAQRWVAHDAELLASDVTRPERVTSLEEALVAFAGLGIPAQNVAIADRSGRVGWTIAGPIPNRVGHDGSVPASWADGTRRWDGYLRADAFPRIVDPEDGRLWTANAPVVTGDALAVLGEGGYADGIRARIIRDRLRRLERATERDMLAIQLDDQGLFLERWRALALEALTPDAVRGHAGRAEFRRLVETTWTGRATPESAAYRLVREFRSELSRQVFDALTAPAREADPDFDFGRALRSEGPLWPLVTERPAHLVNPALGGWPEQILAAVDAVVSTLTRDGGRLEERTWGDYNRAAVTHPLGAGLPVLGRWLNMPRDPLAGDIYTPRASSPRAGASERMVVSPGREQEGILHMPTGQSGHPLSPHYRDQHRAWVSGEPLPFLPGPAVATLTLVP
ncbi:MAG: penicillin acylase family protein [Acidobacteriota bacterium]